MMPLADWQASDTDDKHYFLSYRRGPVERTDAWLRFAGEVADGIIRSIAPKTVLDVGCAIGLLVEALRDRGVEAFGIDASQHATRQVREDIRPYCFVGTVDEAPLRRYDLVTCFEILEHLSVQDGRVFVEQLCAVTSDVLFSCMSGEDRSHGHLNIQPMAYWAGLFAEQGFLRDLEFDPIAIGRPASVRFQKRSDCLQQVVASYERFVAACLTENRKLHLRALEAEAMLSQQGQAFKVSAADGTSVAALEQTIAEQTEYIDALADRLNFLADRESELRSMLLTAHQDLLQRDEAVLPLRAEMEHRGAIIEGLQEALKERTAWAERMVTEAGQRARVIEELQRALAERSAAEERMTAEAEQRGVVIEQLQQALQERTAWAERMVVEAEQRGVVIEQLQQALQERTVWTERMTAEAEARGRVIEELQAALDARRGESNPPGTDGGPGLKKLLAGVRRSPAGRWARRHRGLVLLYRGVRLVFR